LPGIGCIDNSRDLSAVGLEERGLFRSVGEANEDKLVVSSDTVVNDLLNHIDHKIVAVTLCILQVSANFSASNLF
jgi:hypothetical protein